MRSSISKVCADAGRGIMVSRSIDPLSDVVLTVGREEFCNSLRGVLGRLVPHDIIGAYFIDPAMNMRVLFASGGVPDIADFPRRASDRYARGFWRDDPAVQCMLSQAPAAPISLVARQKGVEIPPGEYRSYAYERPRMLERVSLLRSFADGTVILSLYRTHATGQFGSAEIELIEHQADILSAATYRHFQLCHAQSALRPPRGAVAAKVARWPERLSPKETEVCSALLTEKSVKEAAGALGMQTSTFVTYRKRAFAKLGIGARRDLDRLYGDRHELN